MSTTLRIAGIVDESIVDGPGFRLTVFAQGCRHRCEGCHNPETHDFEGGTIMTVSDILTKLMENPLLDGVTLSGGDPFEQAEAFAELAKEIRFRGYHVMTYSGYTFEAIQQMAKVRPAFEELLNATHILVDGPFKQQERCHDLLFRGSRNQRLIDVDATRANGRVCLYKESINEQAS